MYIKGGEAKKSHFINHVNVKLSQRVFSDCGKYDNVII